MKICKCGNIINNIKSCYCEKCRKDRWNKWYKDNKNKKLEYNKKYYSEHPNLFRDWNNKNRNKRNAISKKWRDKNKQHVSIYNSNYRKTPDGILKHRSMESKRHYNYDSISLNYYFEESHQHHLDETTTVFMPKNMHEMCWHRQTLPITMIAINYMALFFIMQQNIKTLGEF